MNTDDDIDNDSGLPEIIAGLGAIVLFMAGIACGAALRPRLMMWLDWLL
jgi:hypothetical protein